MAQAIAARNTANINRPRRPRDGGGTRGKGRERGAPIEAAVVLTVTVTLVAELSAVTGLDGIEHVASAGAPVQVKLTLWSNPPAPVKLKV
jgi:hypothetical protein